MYHPLTLFPPNYFIKIFAPWSCVSLPRPTTSKGWKLLAFLARLLILIKKGGLLQLKFGVVGVGVGVGVSVGVGVNIYLWAR